MVNQSVNILLYCSSVRSSSGTGEIPDQQTHKEVSKCRQDTYMQHAPRVSTPHFSSRCVHELWTGSTLGRTLTWDSGDFSTSEEDFSASVYEGDFPASWPDIVGEGRKEGERRKVQTEGEEICTCRKSTTMLDLFIAFHIRVARSTLADSRTAAKTDRQKRHQICIATRYGSCQPRVIKRAQFIQKCREHPRIPWALLLANARARKRLWLRGTGFDCSARRKRNGHAPAEDTGSGATEDGQTYELAKRCSRQGGGSRSVSNFQRYGAGAVELGDSANFPWRRPITF